MLGPKKLDLSNIGGGELMAHVERELSKICESIADPNIKASATRSLDIKIKIKPDDKRVTAEIAYSVNTKIPGAETSKTTAFIAMEQGELALFGMDTRQQAMFEPVEPTMTEIRPVSSLPKLADPPAPNYATPPNGLD